jgi:hypothetical protein
MTYPVRILSLGAGVQSTTLLLMMLEGEIPRADHVIFADVGWEPQRVYTHLEYLRDLMEQAEMPFHMVTEGNIRADYLDGTKRAVSMPLHILDQNGKRGMVRRQCTAEYKIKPLMKKQRELAGLKRGERCKEHRVTTVIGISYDEVQRMRDPAFPWIQNEYPLIDRKITRRDCIDWCKERGYPEPPRSACIGCPFKSQDEWIYLKQNPEEWADAVDFDNQLRENLAVRSRFRGTAYLHKSGKPLPEVDLRTSEELGVQSLFNQECEGMCGL